MLFSFVFLISSTQSPINCSKKNFCKEPFSDEILRENNGLVFFLMKQKGKNKIKKMKISEIVCPQGVHKVVSFGANDLSWLIVEIRGLVHAAFSGVVINCAVSVATQGFILIVW